jgi:hypothetical protein
MHYAGLILLAISLFFFTFSFLSGCFEKMAIRMYMPAELGSIAPYMRAMMERAIAMDFQYRCGGIHTKFREKLPAVLMASKDLSILAIIAEGKIWRTNTKHTILMSRATTGQIVLTVDDVGTAELDPGTTRQIVMNADFPQLLKKHLDKLSELGVPKRFSVDAGWEAVYAIYRERTERIVAVGLARYADPKRESYRYTVWGAFRASFVHGIVQALYPPNYWRNRKRRPG